MKHMKSMKFFVFFLHSYPIDGRNTVVGHILTNKHTWLRLGRQNVNPHFF